MELVERLSMLVSMRSKEPITLREADGTRVGLAPSSHVFPESPEPFSWKWARSKGVAIAPTWEEAATRARWELIERDRVLRSFYGDIMPRRLPSEFERMPTALKRRYTFQAYAFDAPRDGAPPVAALFGFPRGNDPLVYGFGGRATLNDAVAVAVGECFQRLGFLFGEAVPDESPSPSPTADFHQEYF